MKTYERVYEILAKSPDFVTGETSLRNLVSHEQPFGRLFRPFRIKESSLQVSEKKATA